VKILLHVASAAIEIGFLRAASVGGLAS